GHTDRGFPGVHPSQGRTGVPAADKANWPLNRELRGHGPGVPRYNYGNSKRRKASMELIFFTDFKRQSPLRGVLTLIALPCGPRVWSAALLSGTPPAWLVTWSIS